jgi:creatinine amidohydrolase
MAAPTKLDKRLVSNLTWSEFADRVESNYAFLIPTGSIEEHGLHMPLSMDTMSAYEMSLRLANSYPAVIMPPFTYGYRSQAAIGGGDAFQGTTCLSAEALAYTTRDILLELLRHQVRRIAFLNGHLENVFFIIEGIELARRAQTLGDTKILFTSWDQFVKQATLDDVFKGAFPGWALEHAAVIETSVMLALRPEVVDIDKLPNETVPRVINYTVFPTPPDVVTSNGALSPAMGASKEIGRKLLSDVWDGYERAFEMEFGLKPNPRLGS